MGTGMAQWRNLGLCDTVAVVIVCLVLDGAVDVDSDVRLICRVLVVDRFKCRDREQKLCSQVSLLDDCNIFALPFVQQYKRNGERVAQYSEGNMLPN